MPTLQDLKDLMTIVSLAIASSVALVGLNAWKVQTQKKYDWELARRCLRAIYQVRDVITLGRGPLYSTEEMSFAAQEEQRPTTGIGRQDSDHGRIIQSKRLAELSAAKAALLVEALEAEAIWGEPGKDKLMPIVKAANRFLDAIWEDVNGAVDKQMDEHSQSVLFTPAGSGEQDWFREDLDAAVDTAERYLVRKLRL